MDAPRGMYRRHAMAKRGWTDETYQAKFDAFALANGLGTLEDSTVVRNWNNHLKRVYGINIREPLPTPPAQAMNPVRQFRAAAPTLSGDTTATGVTVQRARANLAAALAAEEEVSSKRVPVIKEEEEDEYAMFLAFKQMKMKLKKGKNNDEAGPSNPKPAHSDDDDDDMDDSYSAPSAVGF